MKKEDGSDTYGLSQIGDVLGRDFEIIARKWMEKERKELANASNAHRSELRNQIPKYLKALGAVLSTEKEGRIDHHLLARDHGIQRWTVGWVLSEVVADYQLLQITILEHLAEAMKRSLTIEEMKTFGAFIDEAIMVAVTAFTAESESELRSLNETLEERVIERPRLAEDRAEKLKKIAIELTKNRKDVPKTLLSK